MLIYNTTFHLHQDVEENFLIWLKEVHIPEVEKEDVLRNPRICKILSHAEPGESTYALQWEVDSPAELHRWQMSQGSFAKDQVQKIFNEKVLGFETLMRIVE